MPVFFGVTVLAGAFAIVAVLRAARRSVMKPEKMTPGFGLADLWELHRSGQLNDEEYERARASLLTRVDQLQSDPGLSSSPSISARAQLGRAQPRGFDVIVKPDEPSHQ
jgi:hypothetical protein